MAGQYPSQFDPNGPMWRNPEGTVPLPAPADIPRPQWYTQRMALKWFNPEEVGTEDDPFAPGLLWTAVYGTPVFDLRPDLRSATAGPKDGVPIWSTAARLYIQLFGNPAGTGIQPILGPNQPVAGTPDPVGNLLIFAIEWANTTFNYSSDKADLPLDLGVVTAGAGLMSLPPINVSAKFSSTGSYSTLAGFAPPGTTLGSGDGYPVRFWRLSFVFRSFVETGLPIPDPLEYPQPASLILQATVY